MFLSGHPNNVTRSRGRHNCPEFLGFGFGSSAMIVSPHCVDGIMPRLQDELVYVLMNRQPTRAEHVTHALLGPCLDAGCFPVLSPVCLELTRCKWRYVALKLSSLSAKCLNLFGGVRAQIDESSPIGLRNLRANNKYRFPCISQINISPI